MSDTIKVKIAFDEDPSKVGETRDVDPVTARIMVADGTAQYATEAQGRKADPMPVAKP